ncbi:MAG: flavin reductase family protein [Deltaproteobacteria bacterium]|nr:flavin reductase family protein [Kofleriaceae bacterium]
MAPGEELSQRFKDALASWASGVSIVATRSAGLVHGVTVSSFASLSLEPPLVIACIAQTSKLPPMVRESRRFAISLLSQEQHDTSAAFARSGREPAPGFAGVAEERTSAGMPIVAGAMAFLDCELHAELGVGDHTIFVGRVIEAATHADRSPLVYYRRKYRRLAATT